jgi:hypothetical protein
MNPNLKLCCFISLTSSSTEDVTEDREEEEATEREK